MTRTLPPRPDLDWAYDVEIAACVSPCPTCSAEAGRPCSRRQSDGALSPVETHPARLQLAESHRITARNLDLLAAHIEAEVCRHTNQHVGVRLEWDGSVWIRLGFAPSFEGGTWTPTAR